MIKIVSSTVGILLAVLFLYMGLIYGASEFAGEVVTLDRRDAVSYTHLTLPTIYSV